MVPFCIHVIIAPPCIIMLILDLTMFDVDLTSPSLVLHGMWMQDE